MEWIALKSGWLYERKPGVLLSKKWEPRWVVLYGEPVPAIGIYEQRSDATPPYAPLKHVDLPPETIVRTAGERTQTPASVAGLLGWIRRTSVDVGASMAELKLSGGERERLFWVSCKTKASGGPAFKMNLLAGSQHERDAWVGAIKGVLMGAALATNSGLGEETTASATPVTSNNAAMAAATMRLPLDSTNEAITCGGVVIFEGRVVHRIRAIASTGGTVNNPLVSRSTDSGDSLDSIVGALEDSCAVIRDVHDELDEINFKYQQAMADRSKAVAAGNARDTMRLELTALKLVGRFHDLASRKLIQVVDSYHQHRLTASSAQAHQFEEGSLRIQFIADYAAAEEELIAAAYAWIRQEMIAARWIATKGATASFLQPLMSVLEYKGFRALAMLTLPTGGHTMVMQVETGLQDESVAGRLKILATDLNLVAAYPYRLSDGRVLQCSLSPVLEVHRLEQATGGAAVRTLKGTETTTARTMTARTPAGTYLTNVHDIVPAYPVTDDMRGLLYFRPEFIASLGSPVAPGDMQPESKQLVLKQLRDGRLNNLLLILESLQELPGDSEEWRLLMHRHGLNMALLGAIAETTRLPHVREGALIEMVARTMKLILRSRLRGAILHFREVQALRVEEELAAIVLETLNGVLTGDSVWMEELVTAIEDRFGYRTDGEQMRHLPRPALLTALQHHCAVRFKETAMIAPGGRTRLEVEDFLGFTVSLTNGGQGPLSLTSGIRKGGGTSDALAEFAGIILAGGTSSLWQMEGRRAQAAKMLLRLAGESIDGATPCWEEAWRWTELAVGFCPRQHPAQVFIQLMMTRIRVEGPAVASVTGGISSVLGEKAIDTGSSGHLASHGTPLILLEEVKKARLTLLPRIDRHYGGHHPIGIQVRLQLARLMEAIRGGGGKELALGLRKEALTMAHKVLGRRHPVSKAILVDYADALLADSKYDEALVAYGEALQQRDEDICESLRGGMDGTTIPGVTNIGTGFPSQFCRTRLLYGLLKCWRAKGDYEAALKWALQCREQLETGTNGNGVILATGSSMIEKVLEEIAELSVHLYEAAAMGDSEVKTGSSALKALLSEDFIADPIAKHLQTAVTCYARLFEARRTRHDLDTADGERLLRLVRKIVFLSLRLATPAQRTVIRAAARRKLFVRDNAAIATGEGQVRELLVRMVAGPATPQELVEKVLQKAQAVETVEEAEADLAILLDLIEIVQ